MIDRSDKWDNEEKALDKNNEFIRELMRNSKSKPKIIKAFDIYEKHKKKHCSNIQIMISKDKETQEIEIITLRCSDCGWNYFHKKWWKFL